MKENNEKGPERPETNKVLVIDIETTSRSPSTGHMIEIGMAVVDTNILCVEHIGGFLLTSPEITSEELENSWAWENSIGLADDIYKKVSLASYGKSLTLDDFIKLSYLESLRFFMQQTLDHFHTTAFNSGFDFKFLEAAGFEIPYKAPCIMRAAREVVQATDKNGRIKNPTVKEAYDHFFPGNDYVEQHRGVDDAYHEAQILLELYKMGKFVI